MPNLIILLRLVVSAILSGLIGIERELHGCAAGLRTHILVCVGATLFMITSILIAASYGHVGEADPSRIAAGVVTGIGFLGAGAIIRYGASIRGLTTAASIWAVAAVGLAVGAGMYEAASIASVVVLAVLILSRLEERTTLKRQGKKLSIRLNADLDTNADDIRNIIDSYRGRIKRIASEKDETKTKIDFVFDIILPRVYEKDIVAEISSLPGVENVSLK